MEKMKLYFAAPLFDDMELARNLAESKKFEDAGYEVFLPQRDAGEAFTNNSISGRRSIFKNDIRHVVGCDVLVAYLDGRVPDEGTVFELGLAYALRKKIAIVSTDNRSFMRGHPNVMLEYCARWFKSAEEVIEYWRKDNE